MKSPFSRRSNSRSIRPAPLVRRRGDLGLDRLENRRLLAITPGTVYGALPATYTDADGDTVTISVTGELASGSGFTVDLAGRATDNADATRINLSGLTANNGLQVVVTPNKLTSQPGTGFADLYSAGYTSIAFVSNEVDPTAKVPALPMTGLGGIQLSAAVVNSISLSGIAIGDITLDAGEAPYIDRINTQNNQQATDSKLYQPVTGLIDLGGITAASIDSLVINGAVSAPTGNPYDTSVTNDFRSVVNVSGAIGSVIGLRSSVSGAIRADSIGSVRVAAIAGEITTRNSAEAFSINLPTNFKGFINSAGHLNVGFPLSDGGLITGQISAGGGISGSDKASTTDPLFIPGGYAGSLANSSKLVGIADIAIDGEGLLGLTSASSIGNVSADGFSGDFVAEAGTSIGAIDAGSQGFEGHLQAGTDIGAIKAVRTIVGTMIAGRNIGTITTVEGNLESLSIQAGGNIGAMSLYTGMLATSLVAGGDIGAISIPVGGIELSYLRATNIGPVTVVDGSIETTSFVATNDIAAITAFGSIKGYGISDVSIVAARNIAEVVGQAHTGNGIEQLKVEAGGDVAGITGISFGEFGALANAGIFDTNIVGANIAKLVGISAGGIGIERSKAVTWTARNGAGEVSRSQGDIGLVSGRGWLGGLVDTIVVAHADIGAISGTTVFEGSGISGGSYDANYGSIGQITADGGAGFGRTGGNGITATRFQATDLEAGGIAGITTSANANGGDALADTTVHAKSIGPIKATVHGGVEGNGIVGGEIRAFAGPIASIGVDVRSINGIGILDGKITASGDIGPMTVWAFNAAAISGGEFQSRGNFAAITATAEKGGNAIENATFTAPGRIFYDDAEDPTLDRDPQGSFGAITANANGTSKLSNGIVDSKFSAIGDIGLITVKTKGGTAILGSTFAADTDGDYSPTPSPMSPGQASGAIAGITVVAAGRNLAASSGIVDSTFTAANIGAIVAKVQTVEGGNGILRSTFTARTAVYDEFGNFDNTGRIGDITVRNAADQLATGAGISTSAFSAGAAGGIGNITVTTASGSGIITSFFDASIVGIDLDQNLYTSTIGTITVTSGRVLNFTLVPAGITGSTFTSAAGIGDIIVNSIGSGITASAFVADFDWTLAGSIDGTIGNVLVRVPGRNASAVTLSTFIGAGIGTIDVRLTDNAQQGINAVALSTFTARTGRIGNVTVIHSQTGTVYNAGLGYAILTSTFSAATGIGAITIQGRTLAAVFIVSGAPVARVAARAVPATSIGNVSITPADTTDLTFDTTGSIGTLSFLNAPAGASIGLTLAGTTVGTVTVDSPGSFSTANLNVTARVATFSNLVVDGNLTLSAPTATTLGVVTVGGNASLATRALQTLGDLTVGGTLTLGQGLPSLRQSGAFTAGSLAAVTKNVQIGSSATTGSSIGAIRITNANRSKGVYQFAFAKWPAEPNVIIGNKTIKVATSKVQTANGLSIVKLKK
jgi:hypothetical protein